MKTNKSYSKRIKVTKNGKLKHRKPGFNHFNARQRRRKQLSGKVEQDFIISPKARAQFIQHG